MSDEQNIKPKPEGAAPGSSAEQKHETEKNEQFFPEDIHAPEQPATVNPQPVTENIPERIESRQEPATGSLQPSTINQTTINQTSEIKDMEVHKHPHHVTHKKKFGEYFLEFLMLFLAVFLGFIAENIREHYVEHERARVFAASMVNELEGDTAELRGYISYMTLATGYTDTLIQLLSGSDPKDIPTGKLYWYGLWGGASRSFVSNDATFQQMKSSGSLRYFTNKTINFQVGQYDRLYRKIKDHEGYDMDVNLEVRKLRSLIFDVRYNAAANNIYLSNPGHPDQRKIDSFMLTSPPLLTYDRVVFNQYLEMVRSRFFRNKIRDADSLLNIGTKLISELKEEYHIE
ncbi:MAG TPA: hypothetical protein VFW07_13635 [Parafilimonas sp.]|nr:hypothetical protein [Parafilimonas sp.]